MRYFFLILFFLFCSVMSWGQKKMGYEIGIQGGTSFYFGDINPNLSFDEYSYSGTILGRWIINKRSALRGQISYGHIYGDDKNSNETYQKTRNLNFETQLIELGAVYEFNFMPYSFGNDDEWFTPYVFLGAGVFYYNPTTVLDGETYNLKDFKTEGIENEYETIQPNITYGVGIKYNINWRWSLNGEAGIRNLFTDYLDDISSVYPEVSELPVEQRNIAQRLSDRSTENGIEPIASPGLQRGNTQFNDHYMFLQIGVTYHINNLKCPNPF